MKRHGVEASVDFKARRPLALCSFCTPLLLDTGCVLSVYIDFGRGGRQRTRDNRGSGDELMFNERMK